MVRIKHRYLLLHILYPEDPPPHQSATNPPSTKPKSESESESNPDLINSTPQQKTDLLLPQAAPPQLLPPVVQFHQPTSDDLTPQILARIIKDQIALLYGDYGVGVTAGGLNGKIFLFFVCVGDGKRPSAPL